MTVSPEERFHQRQPRYSKEDFTQRGDEIYQLQVRQQIDEEIDRGRIVAIDIETGEFELADDTMMATRQLYERLPDAQPWVVRIGYRAVRRFGARSLKDSLEGGLVTIETLLNFSLINS